MVLLLGNFACTFADIVFYEEVPPDVGLKLERTYTRLDFLAT